MGVIWRGMTSPSNTLLSNVGSMLGQRRRRRTNIEAIFGGKSRVWWVMTIPMDTIHCASGGPTSPSCPEGTPNSYYAISPRDSQQTQNICISSVQRRPNVFDVGPTLYRWYTNILCLLWFIIPSTTNPAVRHFTLYTAWRCGLRRSVSSVPWKLHYTGTSIHFLIVHKKRNQMSRLRFLVEGLVTPVAACRVKHGSHLWWTTMVINGASCTSMYTDTGACQQGYSDA